jgi:hypothetical protein
MPYEIVFDNLPGGYSSPRGIKSGEEYTPVIAGFSFSGDGGDPANALGSAAWASDQRTARNGFFFDICG